MNMKLREMSWLMNRKFLSLKNKLILYKSIIKPNGHMESNYGCSLKFYAQSPMRLGTSLI
jgi:hypothetical protein